MTKNSYIYAFLIIIALSNVAIAYEENYAPSGNSGNMNLDGISSIVVDLVIDTVNVSDPVGDVSCVIGVSIDGNIIFSEHVDPHASYTIYDFEIQIPVGYRSGGHTVTFYAYKLGYFRVHQNPSHPLNYHRVDFNPFTTFTNKRAYAPVNRVMDATCEGTVGWTFTGSFGRTLYEKHSGEKSIGFVKYDEAASGSAHQNINLNNIDYISFWARNSTNATASVFVDSTPTKAHVSIVNDTWSMYTIDVKDYTGTHSLYVTCSFPRDGGTNYALFDNFKTIYNPATNLFTAHGFEESANWIFLQTYITVRGDRPSIDTVYCKNGKVGLGLVGYFVPTYPNQPSAGGTWSYANLWTKIAYQPIDLTDVKKITYWSKGDIQIVIDDVPYVSHMGNMWAQNEINVIAHTGIKNIEIWARNEGAAVDTFEAYEDDTIQYSYIYGSVRDSYDGVGINGANISVIVDGKTYDTNTDSTGAYFLMFPEGSRTIQFSAFGYMDDTIEHEFTRDVFYEYNAHLVSKFKTFSGIVIDATTGNHVGAGVNISTVQAGVYSNTSTDVNGRFSLPGIVPLYAITVTATHEDYTHAPVSFVVPLMESPEFVANLYVFPVSFAPVGNSIYGLIYGEYGQPVAWANITISMSGNTMSRTASETGYYLFEDITAGQYAINITAAEHRPSDYSVYVQNGTRQDFYMLKLQVMPDEEVGTGVGVVPAGMILQRFRLIDISNTHKLSACQMRLDLTENNKTSTVFSSFFDFNARTSTYLNLTKMYTLYVILPDNTTINYGLYSPDPDGNTEIYIGELNIYLRDDWIKYGFSKSDAGAISLDYTSELDIESCSFVVYSNESVAYSALSNTNAGSFTYAGNTTKNYRVTFIAKATNGKKIEITKFVSWSGDGVQPIRLHILPESAPGWLYNMISIAIIVITLLIFGQYRMEVGCVMSAMMAGLTWYWGWFQVNGIIVAVVCIIAVAAVMQRTRRA